MGIGVALGDQHFCDAGKLGGGLGRALGALAATGDQHVDLGAQLGGRGQRLVGGVLQRGVFVFGNQQRGHQRTPASFLSFDTSSATSLTLTPPLRPGGSVVLRISRCAREIDAVIGGALVGDRLLLRLHDVGQAGVARLVQPQIGSYDRRALQFQGLQAAIDLARHLEIGTIDFELGGKGRLRPSEQRRQHLAGLVEIVVDRLLAENDEAGFLFVDDGLEDLGHRQRFDVTLGLDQDAAVGAHGETGADGFGGLGRADRHHHDLGCLAGLSQAQGFLDGNFVERIYRHLDVGQFDARSVALDADLDVVIDDPLYRHQNLHRPSFA